MSVSRGRACHSPEDKSLPSNLGQQRKQLLALLARSPGNESRGRKCAPGRVDVWLEGPLGVPGAGSSHCMGSTVFFSLHPQVYMKPWHY